MRFKYLTLGITNLALFAQDKYLTIDNICAQKKPTRKNLEAAGLSVNEVLFYDIDKRPSALEITLIEKMFEQRNLDCCCFKTTKGYHFVSFCLNLKNDSVKAANSLSKQLEEDYCFYDYDYQTLRVAPKLDIANDLEIHKEKPKYLTILRLPAPKSVVSAEHLRAYSKLGFPEKLKQFYFEFCEVREFTTPYIRYLTKQ